MFIRQLNYLIALDRHRHFGRAAESCHVSQPALSNGIRELERELGITVIRRNRTFEGVTPEGERVIEWARQVLGSLDGLRQEAELVRSVPQGHLAIGVIPTASHGATLLSTHYRERLPQLTLEVMSLATPDILQRLKSQELQLGIVYDRSVISDDHDVLPLFPERYVLVASDRACLPHQLSWPEVAGMPLCLLSRDMQNRQMLEEVFRQAGAMPNVVVQTNSMRVLLAEARSGRAFSVLPLSALPAGQEVEGLHVHPVTPEHVERVCLVRLRRQVQPALSEAAWRIAGQLDLAAILDNPAFRPA
ncbi:MULTISPECIES: LysR substrate-binding domain-containing protein [Burkholderia]|uniref:DNA-binding transcriptional regulator CynR n=1 Tax=Burkholderia paludis TaxID=1506587 RepID=A0A6J5F5J0_9BURK|nr:MULTISPECIES: LysR substrate-binding domain-containing protein [Burkholderia]CAB3774120.1 HTH-type transcriptional regulator CynR [Burkholderia paludis]VWC46440.1 DNA-binding transcriptional regulator CynR [Burkholderia paludis]